MESCCLHFHHRKWRKQVPSKDWYGTISKNKAILHFSVTYFLSYGLEFQWGQLVRHAVKNISICLVFQSSEMLCHIPSCSILDLPAVPSLAFITERFLSSWMWCHSHNLLQHSGATCYPCPNIYNNKNVSAFQNMVPHNLLQHSGATCHPCPNIYNNNIVSVFQNMVPHNQLQCSGTTCRLSLNIHHHKNIKYHSHLFSFSDDHLKRWFWNNCS